MALQRSETDILTFMLPGPFQMTNHHLLQLRLAMGFVKESSILYWQHAFEKYKDLKVESTSPSASLQPHIVISYQGDYMFPDEVTGSISNGTLQSVFTVQIYDLQPNAKERLKDFFEFLKTTPYPQMLSLQPKYLWTKQDEYNALRTFEGMEDEHPQTPEKEGLVLL